MKTLCELKRKEVAKFVEALSEEGLTNGFLCRRCLRFYSEKKRLCEPMSLKKIWSQGHTIPQLHPAGHGPEPLDTLHDAATTQD